LLGLFPGVICDSGVPLPPVPKRAGLRPFLRRYDGFWLDFEKELPYPMPPPGGNFMDLFENFLLQNEKRGNDTFAKIIQVPPEYLNPYALGHLVNHPPPDQPANISLIDFDLPYSFFPINYSRYIPYIKYREEPTKAKTYETRNNDVFRAVAMVATVPIAHGDELFVDYMEDERINKDNLPDWLLEPPQANPYLDKRELTAKVPFTVKLLYSYHSARLGIKIEEFEARTTKELPPVQAERKLKAIQARLEKQNMLLGNKEENTKLIESKR
jgi:hypothetical protein